MSGNTCAGITAAPPCGVYTAAVFPTMLLLLSFLTFFLLENLLKNMGKKGTEMVFNFKRFGAAKRMHLGL